MRVLVVKLSSLGDVIHTLPALGDAAAALPDLVFDWVVEEAFAEIPAWHGAVKRVIPVAIRRWRKRPLRDFTGPEWRAARKSLQEQTYDAVIDAQGLLKSALIARLVPAPRYGMDRATVREQLAALAYDHTAHVPRDMHAVERTRLLFARSLGYPLPNTFGEYGIDAAVPAAAGDLPRGLLFFHGTARAEKLWPQSQWMALVKLAEDAGYRVWLPWGNDEELQRARQIAGGGSNTEVLPRMNLRELAGLLQSVKGAVAIDTGLGHLAAALAVPTVSLYGPTRTSLVGAYGRNQVHLQSPVVDDDITDPLTLMQAITATTVWQALVAAIEGVA